MDEPILYPRYRVGDFVRCVHVFYNFHYYYGWTLDEDEHEPEDDHFGIIVGIDYACWDGYEDQLEILYIVYCTDGIKRFFSEDEVFQMS